MDFQFSQHYLLKRAGIFVGNLCWVYFQTPFSVPLISVFIFMSKPYCFGSHNFVTLKSWSVIPSALLLFKIALATGVCCDSIWIWAFFPISLKDAIWILTGGLHWIHRLLWSIGCLPNSVLLLVPPFSSFLLFRPCALGWQIQGTGSFFSSLEEGEMFFPFAHGDAFLCSQQGSWLPTAFQNYELVLY